MNLDSIDIPPPPEAERLNELKARREKLEQKLTDETAKLKRMQADRRALMRKQIKRAESRLSQAERKLDTRRKILIGTAVIAEAETDPRFRKWLTQDFPAHLTRARERALFDLPPLDEAGAPADGWLSRWTSRLGDAAPSWLRFRKETS